MQPNNYGQPFYQPGFDLPVSMPSSYHGLQYGEQQFYHPEMYLEMMQASPMANIAIHSEDFPDRTETKPRLAKQEVELLERHFQENHKPPSSLKRQLAENMGVQVCRINNWFQNRRAKAKHEAKQAARLLKLERSQSGERTPEDYDLSKDFSEMFEEEKPTTKEKSRQPQTDSAHTTTSYNHEYEDPVAASSQPLRGAELDSQAEFQPDSFDFAFDHQAEVDQFGATIYNTMAGMDHAQYPDSVSGNMIDYNSLPYTTPLGMENMDRQAVMMPTSNRQNYSNAMPAQGGSKSTFPSQLPSDNQNLGGLSTIHDGISCSPGTTEKHQEGSTMRFMSPPPSADIASRRSKRRPAPIGTDAIRDRSSPSMRTPLTAAPQRRATKSPGTGVRRATSIGTGLNVLGSRVAKSVAPLSQSPLRPHFPHELKKFAGMDTQVNLIQSSTGFGPPTPRSPNERSERTKVYPDEDPRQYSNSSEQEYDIQSGNQEPPQNYLGSYDLGFSPPETPGGGYHWAGYDAVDSALHTPGFGSFPSDPFALQMPQPLQIPQYVSGPIGPDSSVSHGQGPMSDIYHAQMPMSHQYLSPQDSELSVSPQSSCNNVVYNNNQFDIGAEGKLHVQYQWDQQGSDYHLSLSAHSSPEQSRNQGSLVFRNATPRDFEGKATSGSP